MSRSSGTSDVEETDFEPMRDNENEESNQMDVDDNDEEKQNEFNAEDEAVEMGVGRRIDPATSRKHVIRNKIPTLNTERLKGPKGIHTIETYFEGFKFHGKGREKLDLDRIMVRLEHWCHRLFPKLSFGDFLTKAEKLGAKKDLQTFIKKYRLDMITKDDEVTQNTSDAEMEPDEITDEFDQLIAEQLEKKKQMEASEVAARTASQNDFDILFNMGNTVSQSQASADPVSNNAPEELSDELKEKIERKRQEAMQKKLARQRAKEEADGERSQETSRVSTQDD